MTRESSFLALKVTAVYAEYNDYELVVHDLSPAHLLIQYVCMQRPWLYLQLALTIILFATIFIQKDIIVAGSY